MNFNKPKYKLYGFINYPNKWIGQHLGYPVIDRQKCINCYRCIHHCSDMALSLFKKKRHKKTIKHKV